MTMLKLKNDCYQPDKNGSNHA